MKLQKVLDKIIASKPHDWHRIRRAHSPDSLAPDAHTDYAVLTSDVAITLAWGMTAGGAYHEPWATRCPNPSAWTGFFDIRYHRTLVHRDVYVSVDGDRCYLPLPRNLDNLRVPAGYAIVTAILSILSLGSIADGIDRARARV